VGYSIRSSIEINGNVVNFQDSIKRVTFVDDLIVVLLDNPLSGKVSDQPMNNIYAMDQNGDIVWEIKEIIKEDRLYTIIRLNDQNQLVAADFIGIKFTIDVKSKTILSKYGSKD
jgi:uncharacterized secreted protein with C-terminal beta-propeller domain